MKRRRRVLIGLAVLLVGIFTWKWIHRRDVRLVGRWRVAEVAATAESTWIAGRSNESNCKEWIFDSDGRGRAYSPESISSGRKSFLVFRWRTDGERLLLQWGEPGSSLGELQTIFEDLRRSTRGESPTIPQHEYRYDALNEAADDGARFVLCSQGTGHLPSGRLIQLERIEENRAP